jgi:hypothetical protein
MIDASLAELAGDLRAKVARAQLRLYEVAAFVPMSPPRLSGYLGGVRPLTPELAARIDRAIDAALTARTRRERELQES